MCECHILIPILKVEATVNCDVIGIFVHRMTIGRKFVKMYKCGINVDDSILNTYLPHSLPPNPHFFFISQCPFFSHPNLTWGFLPGSQFTDFPSYLQLAQPA